MSKSLSRTASRSFISRGRSPLSLILLSVLLIIAIYWQAQGSIRQESMLQPQKAPKVKVQGGGAAYPNPIYQTWLSIYQKSNPDVTVDYQSIGSGGGVKLIVEQTIDFGGSDAPMSDEDMAKAHGQILHIPTTLGAVVLTYNVPGVTGELNLSQEALVGIYLGKITKWNDPAIASVNRGLDLPASEITIIHRSDRCNATMVFTDYLSKISREWKDGPGTSTCISWPQGPGAEGNEEVNQQVKHRPGAIGYIDFIFAKWLSLPMALIENPAGGFVRPSFDSITAAAAATDMPDDLRVSITNAPRIEAYPISFLTYLLIYKEQTDKSKGKALKSFLKWVLRDGQQKATDLSYAPLPENVVEKAERLINTMTLPAHTSANQ
jgi:phosphate transport system substrate-binding protein